MVAEVLREVELNLDDADAQYTNAMDRTYPIRLAPDGPWDWSGQHDYDGAIDDFRIYDHALSVEEIGVIYSYEATVVPSTRSVVPDAAAIRFDSEAGKDYELQCTEDPVIPQWASLLTFQGTGSELVGVVSASASEKIYRIRVR